MISNIKIKPLRTDFIMPERATKGSAAYDAKIPEDYEIKYGRQWIPLGYAMEMPWYLSCDGRSRSGYAVKGLLAYDEEGNEIRLQHTDVLLGLVDSDYRGEVKALLRCFDDKVKEKKYHLKRGQAICQLAFREVPQTNLLITDSLTDTERGTKGFGAANGE